MKLLLQAGHGAAYAPYRTGGGGAPGEAAWTTDLAARLATRLRAAGVDVTLVGAWLVNGVVIAAPKVVTSVDYDLFVSLHYDGSTDPRASGCCAGRATKDPMGARADAFLRLWTQRYPAALGIPLHQERVGVNVTDYYGFRDTTALTPGVLLEHGYGDCADKATLHAQIDAVAAEDAACILAFGGLLAPEEDDMTDAQRQLLALLDAWQITTPAALQDWKTWSDQTAKDVAALHREVDGLTDQLQHVPTQNPNDLAAVVIRRRSGQEQEIT